jgi:hypothetical protein
MKRKPTNTWSKIYDFCYDIRDKKYGVIFVYVAKREMDIEELNAALKFFYTWHRGDPPKKGSINYICQPILP